MLGFPTIEHTTTTAGATSTMAQAGRRHLLTYLLWHWRHPYLTMLATISTKQVSRAENVNKLSAVTRGTATQTLRVGDPHSAPACQQLEFALRVFLHRGDESIPLQQVL